MAVAVGGEVAVVGLGADRVAVQCQVGELGAEGEELDLLQVVDQVALQVQARQVLQHGAGTQVGDVVEGQVHLERL